ncbi:hypothetical protein KY290_024147 [Solanum tuberosum]|uniref:F-box domain-containing protein n=1 Tax=Solanum tuberosum TaxID=4113 RepID=A0ABQ7URV3_SOLTU|nr:hypothetical protein KY285_022920 [Solanum tuberosum]KAH0753877.1 hypothetical protein KY290_024147 [Solanum tuberosum]
MALRSIWQEETLIDIMDMILKRVGIGDYVRMTLVCKSWRSMLAHLKPSHHLTAPWLLQIKDCVYNDHIGFNFYSLSEDRFYSFKLPTHILNKYPKVSHGATFCCATSNGWLVLVAGPDHNPDMFLFDPISEIDVKLPPLTTIPFSSRFDYRRGNAFQKIAFMVNMVHVFSISNDYSTRNLIVVVNFMNELEDEEVGEILAFCNCDIGVTEEQRSWKLFDADGTITHKNIESMLFHNNVLYIIVSKEEDFLSFKSSQDNERIGKEINYVIVLNSKTDRCELKIKIINIVKHNTAPHIRPCNNELRYIAYSGLKYTYLAKSITGELLIIWNNTDPFSEDDVDYDLVIYHTTKLTIERYEGIEKKSKDFKYISSLGDQTLFVSPNSNSFSIPTISGNGYQANGIYFTVDVLDTLHKKSLALYRQSGIYCMQEGRIKRPFPNPPMWFQPRLSN